MALRGAAALPVLGSCLLLNAKLSLLLLLLLRMLLLGRCRCCSAGGASSTELAASRVQRLLNLRQHDETGRGLQKWAKGSA